MSFSKGRNLFEAYIDEKAEMLERLIQEVPTLIHQEYEKRDEFARNIAKQNSDDDLEVESSIYNSYSGLIDGASEMINDFYSSIVLMISRYCEITLKIIADCEQIKGKRSKIDMYYNIISRKYDIKLLPIKKIWKGKTNFCKKRNSITHEKDIKIDKNYLLDNLNAVNQLLHNTIDLIPKEHIQCLISKLYKL